MPQPVGFELQELHNEKIVRQPLVVELHELGKEELMQPAVFSLDELQGRNVGNFYRVYRSDEFMLPGDKKTTLKIRSADEDGLPPFSLSLFSSDTIDDSIQPLLSHTSETPLKTEQIDVFSKWNTTRAIILVRFYFQDIYNMTSFSNSSPHFQLNEHE